jgi:hypothetical protein
MRQGLKEMGAVLQEVPSLLSECHSITKDLSNLLQLAEIIEHPFYLMFRAGKNFLINGIDIFKKFNLSWTAYHTSNYFDFGRYLGEALDEVLLKAPMKKKLRDEHAYEFLCGYMDGLLHLPLERGNMYNRIDNMGHMIMGPVIKTIQEFETADRTLSKMSSLSEGVWMGLHEFQHVFADNGSALVRKKAISKPQLDHINDYSKCLNKSMFNSQNAQETINLMHKAAGYYEQGDIEGVGESFAELNLRLCGDTMVYTQT